MQRHLTQHFEKNTQGRDLIIGDIHGHFTRVQEALDAVGFNPEAGDRLFSVGDLVDRGPESDQALEWLAKPWFHAVAGNHEDFAIRWPLGNMQAGNYVQNGGAWNVSNPPDVRADFAAAFAALPVAIELETAAGLVGIVHADVPCSDWNKFVARLAFGGSMASAATDHTQWSRARIDAHLDGLPTKPVAGVRAVVVGHTPLPSVTVAANVHHIDTMGWRQPGHFTLLDAATLRPITPASGK